MKAQILRKQLAKQLKEVNTPNVNIMGINIKRKVLSELLNSIDSDTLTMYTGLISWNKTEHKDGFINAIDNEPCLAIDNCRTFVKLLNRPAAGDITYINIANGDVLKAGIQSQGIELESKPFVKAIKNLVIYTAKEPTRETLQCVYFESNGKHLTLAAADGFRLAEVKLKAELPQGKFILTAHDLLDVVKAIGTKPVFKIDIKPDSVIFSTDNSVLTISKVKGDYPSYKSLIPTDKGNHIKVNAKQLHDAVKCFKAVKGNKDILRLQFKHSNTTEPDILTLTGDGCSEDYWQADTKQTGIVDCKLSGDDCRIAINRTYLMDTLKQFGDNIIDMYITTQSSPILFEYDNMTALIMPMSVKWEEV